jgi:GntR family transcriptional regulator, carbon starvation induced regulator
MRLIAAEKGADTRSLAEAVQLRLENDILAGKLVPGERLRLHSLIESYSVGMSPLREALARLAGQGLVIQESQRGFAVVPISGGDLADVTQTRIRIETMAFKLSIETGDAEWEADVLSSHHRLARHSRGAKNLIDEDWEQLHRAFHMSLISACDSPLLLSFCQVLYNHFDRYRRIAVRTARRQPTITRVHAKLVETAIGKKTSEAVQLLTAHIRESEKEILRLAGARMFMPGDQAAKTLKTLKTLSSATTTKTKSKSPARSRDR